jgi:hypothetical protein
MGSREHTAGHSPYDPNQLLSIPERTVWEMTGGRYEDFRQPPYHQLHVTRASARGALVHEVRCPFPTNQAGEHVDLHYCTMVDAWPTLRLAVEGAHIEMCWRAIGCCFVQWECDNTGVTYMLDAGLHVPEWARQPGVYDVQLETYGEGSDFTVWLAPIDPALRAMG